MGKPFSNQREVILRSYSDDEGEFDYIGCGEIRGSESTYRREKGEAISILGAALRLEEFKEFEVG
ncbi:hypothetical protein QP794_01700 [Paenibacillus sp. UMB7766-LJ446]|uniref:hypothetical protein n=1 Tax=Paenibacillus sp. UMB7766-LJ446 TaxID=3046313 RepID=UPI00255077CB|nr:hypothetical protein [Paenibacillus sp. UMB7766-LJ446]MDK8188796.1 hypothetical protein [Paenibacillus sp. UMB7766-LJ446]